MPSKHICGPSAELKGRIADHSRAPVGFCIDTAHCYEAGYDVSTAGGLEETLALIDAELGLANVKVIHANDSKTALGSRVDRHARIGEGHLGKAAFRRMLRHPGLARKPFILEVPAVEGSQVTNVKAFWALARQPRADRPKQTARRTTQS